jgi:WD40 repeat protein
MITGPPPKFHEPRDILWDTATGQPHGQPLTGHTDTVRGVAFSPDGTLLATTSDDQTVRLWDTATGQPHGQPLTGHTGPVYSVAFSPDGTLLATASADRTARLWDTATGQPHGQPLTDHTNTVWGVAFQPRRDPARHQQRRSNGTAVGHRHRATARPTPHRSHRPSVGGGVQPRRDPARPRQR